jgi:D-glycero-D-manno-heptose 1,7-bisphosphate phosphatase
MSTSRRYVLLDRDGTMIVERNYLSDPDQVELIPGAAEGLRSLSRLGLGLLIVTNQSGIGRGYFDEARLAAIHDRMCGMLADQGVALDGIYVCPHTPENGCACRKPRTGLVTKAAALHGFEPGEAFVVGDKASDIALGRRIGACTLLVRTGYGAQYEVTAESPRPDYVVDDLFEAARIIGRLVRTSSAADTIPCE